MKKTAIQDVLDKMSNVIEVAKKQPQETFTKKELIEVLNEIRVGIKESLPTEQEQIEEATIIRPITQSPIEDCSEISDHHKKGNNAPDDKFVFLAFNRLK